ncbi:MAG: TolC family protein [Verrucomicrobia bacterium]|nr:MAG: TolC family protein [Verrucomicrobiota bacterium]
MAQMWTACRWFGLISAPSSHHCIITMKPHYLPFLLLTFGKAISTSQAAPPVNIDSLVATAVDKNPERLHYIAQIEAAYATFKSSGKLANPELGTQIGRKTSQDGSFRAEGAAWSVSLSQTFEWPGRIGLRKAIANKDLELAQLGLQQFTAALTARVRTLAFKTFAGKERETAAREVADRFQSLREVLVQRDSAGLTPKLELRVIEATTLTLRRQAADTALEQKKSLIELNLLLGRPAGNELAIQAPAFALVRLPPQNQLMKLARAHNFEMKIKTAELEQQGFHVALRKNERFPAITVSPMYSQEKAGATDRIVGVGISIPLPLWNRNEANLATSQAKQRQAEAMLRAATIDLEKDIAIAAATYDARREEIGDWKPESIDAFREAAALADKHYRQGAVASAIYLELQQKYLDAVDTLLSAKAEAMEARLHLEELTGSSLDLSKTSTFKKAAR